MNQEQITTVLKAHKDFFNSGATLNVQNRIAVLKKLYDCIQMHTDSITKALQSDLNKSAYEAYITEIGIVLSDITYYIRHTKKWAKPHIAPISFSTFPAISKVYPQPLGTVLVMSPWNYPLQLALSPLVASIAAGNTVILKLSEYSNAVNSVIEDIVNHVFPKEYVSVFYGDALQSQDLLHEQYDFIFFTGSPFVGRIVMENASRYLTPICLELGGKSPCIIDKTANIALCARRIIWGKILNAGQTCVAPDYVLVEDSIKEDLIAALKKEIILQCTEQPLENPSYPHIINRKNFNRILSMAPSAQADASKLCIAPFIADLGNINAGSANTHPLMQEEIFGPILPIITYTDFEEAKNFINSRPSPLALYLFSADKALQQRAICI